MSWWVFVSFVSLWVFDIYEFGWEIVNLWIVEFFRFRLKFRLNLLLCEFLWIYKVLWVDEFLWIREYYSLWVLFELWVCELFVSFVSLWECKFVSVRACELSSSVFSEFLSMWFCEFFFENLWVLWFDEPL